MDFSKTLVPCLGKTAKMLDMFFCDKLSEKGFPLTKQQLLLLVILSKNNGKSQNELAFLTDRDKASLTKLINTLEKKNLMARIPSKEDRRKNLLHITTQGENMKERAMPIFKEIITKVQRGITQTEIDSTIEVLKKLQQNIGKQIC